VFLTTASDDGKLSDQYSA